MKNILKIENITKEYKIASERVIALNNISLNVQTGDCLAIVGESGSGKTTLGRLILGLEKPTKGNIFYNDKNISIKRNIQDQKDIQVVQQNPLTSLNPKNKIYNSISLPLKIHKIVKRENIPEKVMELLNSVGLSKDLINSFPSSLSGGQRQRVAIARAIASIPKIIVLDEPTSALDVLVQAKVLKLLSDIQKNYNLTYLFITHDLGVVRNVSNRVVVLRNGEIVEEGETVKVFQRPKHEYTKNLIRSIPVVSTEEEKIKP
jgi:oligopeptide transport system ATP-binding protein